MLVFIRRIIFLLNALVFLSLVLAAMAGYISPERWWLPGFFGLTYPVWLIANMVFILFWFLVHKRQIWLSILSLIVAWPAMVHSFAFHPFEKQDLENGIKIMTYNVRNFDLYNWQSNLENREKILQMLEGEMPDILCLQEYYTELSGKFENLQTLKKRLELPYHAMHHTFSISAEKHFGQVIFSRYPILSRGIIEFPESPNNACIFADLLIPGDTIRVFNVHLQSIQLGTEGETAVEEMIYKQRTDWQRSKYVFSKLRRGFVQRAGQARILRAAILSSPYKVLLCGDFNDTPASYTYAQLSGELQDAFLKKSFGIGSTFAGNIPALRIDYIFTDPDFHIAGFKRIRHAVSDHYPLLCTIKTESE